MSDREDTPITLIEDHVSSTAVEVPPDLPGCTQEEENFALAYIENGGRVREAYLSLYGNNSTYPLTKGKSILARPQVSQRIAQLTTAIAENVSVSVEAHLDELADIRDLAKDTGQLKTALAAERSRGEAVGIYQRHEPKSPKSGSGTNILIQMVSKHDATI